MIDLRRGDQGFAPDPVDVMIAAVASELRDGVVTRNGKDFERTSTLEVLSF